MKERTGYPQNVAEVARWIHWLVNVMFVLVMLATIALAAWSGYRHRDAGVMGWYYAFFVIGAAVPVAIGAALLLVHGLLTRSHAWLKWPFILLVLTVLTFNASASATQFLGVRDSITVRVENRSDSGSPRSSSMAGASMFGSRAWPQGPIPRYATAAATSTTRAAIATRTGSARSGTSKGTGGNGFSLAPIPSRTSIWC